MAIDKSYSVVIIEYFSGEHIFKCIETLVKQTWPPSKIVVVNNGTHDESLAKLQKMENVHVINPSANLGYSKAANLGIVNTDTEIVATLNPDIELETDCAEILVTYLNENQNTAAVGPLIYELDGSIYPSARKDPSMKAAIGHAIFSLFKSDNKYSREYKNTDIDREKPSKVDWLSGAAIFLSRKALDNAGMWDERFFMYCEDIDLCNTFRKNAYDCVYEPAAKIVHEGGASTKQTPIKYLYLHHKSLYLFASKKYRDNPFLKFAALIFIGVRLPFAIIKSKIPID